MIEVFKDIRKDVKETAAGAWNIAMAQKDPRAATELLDNVINYYESLWTEEEVNFLRFYFAIQMEMMKE